MAKKDKSENSLFGSGVHSRPIDAQGIVAKSKRGKFGESWWADRWIGVLNNFGWGSRLDRGRTYARRGQTLSLDVQPGRVDAKVQGSRVQPYDVAILLPTLKPQTWEKVFDALAQKSIFAAKLLAGEMPHEIEEAFYAAGTWLFPKTELELGQQCSCPDTVRPCKHLAAVHFMVAEKFDEDPFLMFALRGKTKDEVVAALRSRRVGTSEPAVANGASAPAKLEVAPEPVHLSPERFFELRADTIADSVQLDPPSPAVNMLGPLRLEGKEDVVPELEKIIARLRLGALALAFKGAKEATKDAEKDGKDGK
ncbi:MAG: SWIM zinc finger family protein [Planctomycetota bacterium]